MPVVKREPAQTSAKRAFLKISFTLEGISQPYRHYVVLAWQAQRGNQRPLDLRTVDGVPDKQAGSLAHSSKSKSTSVKIRRPAFAH